jgi:hypothetical protein
MKLPFEQLEPEANRLLQKMTSARDLETINHWWDTYVAFLAAAGWTPMEFDRATLKQVDEGWGEQEAEPTILN